MKIDNYYSRWQEFHDWAKANNPGIVPSVESLGQAMLSSIHEYRSAKEPMQRQENMDLIKGHYDRVVQWHMKEILSKLSAKG